MADTPLVELSGICKRFPGVVANDGVSFTLLAGEIHALLGENGAGKSTLMSVLLGMYRPDAGEIRVRGRAVRLRSPRDAARLGIGMVHQHFLQSERHTVLDNVLLGRRGLPFLLRRSKRRAEVHEAAQRFGLELELDAPLHVLPVGERQKVEILRALYHGATILVLDEPTAVLSRQETTALFGVLRRFCAAGGGVVFISHKLDEVLEIADRVTVLRRGRNTGPPLPVAGGLDAPTLVRLMVGHELHFRRREPAAAALRHEPVLRLHDVTVTGSRGLPVLERVSLELQAGEILGIAGVAGSGQAALADLLSGLARPSQGTLELLGRPVAVVSPAAFRRAGVGSIPEDRLRTGLAGALSVAENLILTSYRQRFSRRGLLRWDAARAWSRALIDEYGIQCPGPEARSAGLSGGNLQKIILARELSAGPRLLVAAYPCRGLDVGAAEAVRAHLLAAARGGTGVVLLSEDLDELLRLADRIGVLFRGRLLAVLPAAQATREGLGLLMGGAGGGVSAP